jgi:hypothetical protein
MNKLNEMADHLGEQMEKLQALLIKEPILDEIKKTVDEYFETKTDFKERHVAQYTIGIMSQKIVELNNQVEQLKRQIK